MVVFGIIATSQPRTAQAVESSIEQINTEEDTIFDRQDADQIRLDELACKRIGVLVDACEADRTSPFCDEARDLITFFWDDHEIEYTDLCLAREYNDEDVNRWVDPDEM